MRTGYVVPFESPVRRSGPAVLAGVLTVQVSPLSIEYEMLVMADPPSPPSAKATSTAPLAEITWVIWGASGTVEGTPGSALLAVPGPRLLTARIATE